MGEVVPIRPRERVELPPSPPPARKLGERFPRRLVTALFVPAAALAAAAGLQRWLAGTAPAGDVLGRWLMIASALGAALGLAAAVGRPLREKLAWLLWGASAPWLLALGSVGAVRAVRPVRNSFAGRAEAECRGEGRPACTLGEFVRGCSTAKGTRALAREALGTPAQELCGGAGCTDRYVYEGPWTPDNWVAPGAVVCSVVTDASGKVVRAALSPGTPPK